LQNLALILVCVGLAVLQALIGGARLVYALPGYALLAVAALAVLRSAPARDTRPPSLWCLGSAIALAAYLAIRSRTVAVEYLARPDFFLILAALLIYLLAVSHFTAAQERFAILAALLGYAFFHVAVGAGQFRSGDDYMLLPWIVRPEQYYSRASGFYISPHHLAALLEMLGALSLAIFCWTHSRFGTYLLAIYGVAVCLVGIAISGSPESNVSAILAIAIVAAISIWTVRMLYPERMILAVAVSAACVALLAISATNFFKGEERLSSEAAPAVEKTDVRPVLRGLAWQIHRAHPLMGADPGSFLYHARQLRPPPMQGEPEHAHSEYLELLAEYGYVGAGLAALFVGAHLVVGIASLIRIVRERAKAAKAKRSRELALCIGAFGAVTAMLIHAAGDFSLHIPANALLAAFIFGILANPGRSVTRRSSTGATEPLPLWLRLPAPILGLVLLALTVPRVRGEFYGERARLALRDEQYFRAKDSALLALRAEKKNPDLYYYLGESSHYLGLDQTDRDTRFQQYTEAAEAFAHGLQLFPQDTRLLLKMGRTLDNLGRFAEAAPYFERALAADPNSAQVHACLAVHLQMQGDVEKARALYHRAVALGETVIAPAGLADLEKLRERPFQRPTRPDILADFITEPDVVSEEPAAKPTAREP
jgi:Flp pilus assembly protein TadD/O-antigen ligase